MSFLSPTNGLDPDIGWQRGHVAALEVGGENASYNIVPMKPGFNHGGPWRAVERAVRQAADAHTRGTVRLRVELEYAGPDPRVPSRISCTLEEIRVDGDLAAARRATGASPGPSGTRPQSGTHAAPHARAGGITDDYSAPADRSRTTR